MKKIRELKKNIIQLAADSQISSSIVHHFSSALVAISIESLKLDILFDKSLLIINQLLSYFSMVFGNKPIVFDMVI